jgi:putative membrane protein
MRVASTRFTQEDRSRVAKAVAEAESRTSAEIVPLVATDSGRYDRSEDIVGLWVGAICAGAAHHLMRSSGVLVARPDWGAGSVSLELVALIGSLVVGFVAGAFAASRIGWLRALFTPRVQMRDEVAARARAVFYDGRVHHTAGATGILIYVSLFERMATVIADKTVAEKLGPGLPELSGELNAALASDTLTDAICATVKSAGDRLAAVLPRADDDVNELSDALVLID